MMTLDTSALLCYAVLACGMLIYADGFVIPSATDVKLTQGHGQKGQENKHENNGQSQETGSLQVNGNGKINSMDTLVDRSILLSDNVKDAVTMVSEEGSDGSRIHDDDDGHVEKSDMMALIQRMVPGGKVPVKTEDTREGNHRHRRSHEGYGGLEYKSVQRYGRHTLCRNLHHKYYFINAMREKLCDVDYGFVVDLVLKLCDDKDDNLNMWVKELFDVNGDGYISHTEQLRD